MLCPHFNLPLNENFRLKARNFNKFILLSFFQDSLFKKNFRSNCEYTWQIIENKSRIFECLDSVRLLERLRTDSNQ